MKATRSPSLSKRFSNTLYIRPRVTLRVARKAIRVSRDIPRSLSPVIQLSRMNAASVRRSPGVSSVTAAANIIHRKLLKSRARIFTSLYLDAKHYLTLYLDAHGRWRSRLAAPKKERKDKNRARDLFVPRALRLSEIHCVYIRLRIIFTAFSIARKSHLKRATKERGRKWSYSGEFAFWNFSPAFPSPTKRKTVLGPGVKSVRLFRRIWKK